MYVCLYCIKHGADDLNMNMRILKIQTYMFFYFGHPSEKKL